MASMPDIAAELEAEWDHSAGALRHVLAAHMPHWHGIQAPAQEPVTVETTQEETMSLAADLHAAAERLDKIGEEAVAAVEKIVSDPAVAPLFAVLGKIAGVPIDPAILAGIEAVLKAYAPAQAQDPQQPAA